MNRSINVQYPIGLGLTKQASNLQRLVRLMDKYPIAAGSVAASPVAAVSTWLWGESEKLDADQALGLAQLRANSTAAERLSFARLVSDDFSKDRYGENAKRLGIKLADIRNSQVDDARAAAEDSQEEVAEPVKTTKSEFTSSTPGKKSYRGLGIGAGAGGALGLVAGLALAKDKSLLAKILYGTGGTLAGVGVGAVLGDAVADHLA